MKQVVVIEKTDMVATGQIERGDCIRVSFRPGSTALTFFRETGAHAAWKAVGTIAA